MAYDDRYNHQVTETRLQCDGPDYEEARDNSATAEGLRDCLEKMLDNTEEYAYKSAQ